MAGPAEFIALRPGFVAIGLRRGGVHAAIAPIRRFALAPAARAS
jgi:hypothetical protein